MTRILIVDDDKNLVEDFLEPNIATLFPDVVVDTAHTVDEALQIIERRGDNGETYDFAVLDFMLPKHDIGEQPQLELKLRHDLLLSRAADTHTVVFHITAYAKDQEIIEFGKFLAESLKKRETSHTIVLSKTDDDFPESLYDEIQRVYHTDRICERMDRLFGPEGERHQGANRQRRGRRGSLNVTHEIGALLSDLEHHWAHLEDHLKSRVQDHFHIEESDGRVFVELR